METWLRGYNRLNLIVRQKNADIRTIFKVTGNRDESSVENTLWRTGWMNLGLRDPYNGWITTEIGRVDVTKCQNAHREYIYFDETDREETPTGYVYEILHMWYGLHMSRINRLSH